MSRPYAWLFLFLAVLLPLRASAALDENSYTDSEKVGYAFARLSHTQPDYESWIKQSPAYGAARPVPKLELMKQETERLEKGFYDYDPSVDLIHIEADIMVRREGGKPAAPGEADKTLKILFGNGEPYFPFKVGKMWIVLIPKDGGFLENLSLPPPDYDAAVRDLGFKGAYSKTMPAILDLRLRPLAADAGAPSVVDNIPHWPMLAEITNATIWNKAKTRSVWSYDAQGYISKDKKELLDLYDK